MSRHKKIKVICKEAGVTFLGVQEFRDRCLLYFNHPSNSSTLTLWLEEGVSVERIRVKVEESAKKYMEASSEVNEPKIGG